MSIESRLPIESTPVAGAAPEATVTPGEIAHPMGFPEEVTGLGDLYKTNADVPRSPDDVAELQKAAARIREDDSHYYDTQTGAMLSPTRAARVKELGETKWMLTNKEAKDLQASAGAELTPDVIAHRANELPKRDFSLTAREQARRELEAERAVAIRTAEQRVQLSNQLREKAQAEAREANEAVGANTQEVYDKAYRAAMARSEAKAAHEPTGNALADQYARLDAERAARREAQLAAAKVTAERRAEIDNRGGAEAIPAIEAEAEQVAAERAAAEARDAETLEFRQRLHGTEDGRPRQAVANKREEFIAPEQPAGIPYKEWLGMSLAQRRAAAEASAAEPLEPIVPTRVEATAAEPAKADELDARLVPHPAPTPSRIPERDRSRTYDDLGDPGVIVPDDFDLLNVPPRVNYDPYDDWARDHERQRAIQERQEREAQVRTDIERQYARSERELIRAREALAAAVVREDSSRWFRTLRGLAGRNQIQGQDVDQLRANFNTALNADIKAQATRNFLLNAKAAGGPGNEGQTQELSVGETLDMKQAALVQLLGEVVKARQNEARNPSENKKQKNPNGTVEIPRFILRSRRALATRLAASTQHRYAILTPEGEQRARDAVIGDRPRAFIGDARAGLDGIRRLSRDLTPQETAQDIARRSREYVEGLDVTRYLPEPGEAQPTAEPARRLRSSVGRLATYLGLTEPDAAAIVSQPPARGTRNTGQPGRRQP